MMKTYALGSEPTPSPSRTVIEGSQFFAALATLS